ncbi:CidA/LrgA family protein [Thiomicrorhabdus aquaedulcis]|uniref:CidA/LrgA family protein n=1 Tax=Thiomicrorhabdus aquaedulcis TaxID=2211106 RepID=UPI000FDCA47A|nr:CidA/LrgA family protein [Thiomicrorhabdus aquaedulcis]
MTFLAVITLLLLYQLAGELIVLGLNLPIPGPVVGMLLFLLTLIIKKPLMQQVEKPAQMLLAHLSLLFVPAGVGLMIHLGRLKEEWLAISVALVVSTILGLLVTAWSMMAILKLPNLVKRFKTPKKPL